MHPMYQPLPPWVVTSSSEKAMKLAHDINLLTADGTHPATVVYVNTLMNLAGEFQTEKSPDMVYEALYRASFALVRLSMKDRREFVPRIIRSLLWLGPGHRSVIELIANILPVIENLEPPAASLEIAEALSQLRESYLSFGSGDLRTAEPISSTAAYLYDHFVPGSSQACREHLELALIHTRLGKYYEAADRLAIGTKILNDPQFTNEYRQQILSAQITVYSRLGKAKELKAALAKKKNFCVSVKDFENAIPLLARSGRFQEAIEYAVSIAPKLGWTEDFDCRTPASAQIANWCQDLHNAGASSRVDEFVTRCMSAAKENGFLKAPEYALLCARVSRKYLALCMYDLAGKYARLALETENRQAIDLLLREPSLIKQFEDNDCVDVASRLRAEPLEVSVYQYNETSDKVFVEKDSELKIYFPIRTVLSLEKQNAKTEALMDVIDSYGPREGKPDLGLILKFLELTSELSQAKPKAARQIIAILNKLFPSIASEEKREAATAILARAAMMPGIPRRTGCILRNSGEEICLTNVLPFINSEDALQTLDTAKMLTRVRATYLEGSPLSEAVSRTAISIYDRLAPNSSEAALEHLALGREYSLVRFNLNKRDSAEAELKKALTLANARDVLGPEKAEAMRSIIDFFSWNQEGNELVALLASEEEWIQDQNNISAGTCAVRALIYCGKYSAALVLAQKLAPLLRWTQSTPSSLPINSKRNACPDCSEIDKWAGALQHMGQIEEMDKFYENCLSLAPVIDKQHSFDIRNLCLRAYKRFYELNRCVTADKYANWSLKFLDPSHTGDIVRLAADYEREGRFENARMILLQVLEVALEKEKLVCKLLLARLYLAENFKTAALTQYNEVAQAVASSVESPVLRDYLTKSINRISDAGLRDDAIVKLQRFAECGGDMMMSKALEQHALDNDEPEIALQMCKVRLDYYERRGIHTASAQIYRRYAELLDQTGQSSLSAEYEGRAKFVSSIRRKN